MYIFLPHAWLLSPTPQISNDTHTELAPKTGCDGAHMHLGEETKCIRSARPIKAHRILGQREMPENPSQPQEVCGAIAQQTRVPAAKTKDLWSIPESHMVRIPTPTSCPLTSEYLLPLCALTK